MNAISILFISFVFLFSFIFSYSFSNPGGTLQGKVIDELGNPIPGAVVTIKGPNISPLTTITNESGYYRFTNIPPGTYSIAVELIGFKTLVKENIVIQTDKTETVDFSLAPTAVLEEVIVVGPGDEALSEEEIQDEKIDEEISKIKVGKIMFNPPEEMTEGERERVEVRISQNLKEDLTEKLKGKGIAHVEEIFVSSVMKARLTGGTFKIVAFSEEEQIVSTSGYSQWEWDVTPLKAGMRILGLSVAVSIKLKEFGEKTKSLPVMEKEIVVKVSPKYRVFNFLKNYWAWIIGTVIALIGLYYTIRQVIK